MFDTSLSAETQQNILIDGKEEYSLGSASFFQSSLSHSIMAVTELYGNSEIFSKRDIILPIPGSVFVPDRKLNQFLENTFGVVTV